MTKQEWVQKYLEDILADAWRKGAHNKGIDVTEEADKARFHLTKWGVVIKGGKQLVNPYEHSWMPVEREAYDKAIKDNNLMAVESLMEEEK